ncbi:MBL fold metallo-hydrolase [Sneathiella chungangensis]|uniref:MBL fold metallo-hydrolase n=1 Tax=Sneathiella chungangensis TaxID=1418234 RepID=A0A845MJW0_9PROT|nr:MBL fold metallo-hydrolase [Sneathiella chungangensis]MZR23586.1 MBL fold metallo-hydrolase [Sneathiella chungangensis]
MKQFAKLMTVVCATVAGIGVSFASAENVKVTPLGGQEGEFCRLDRAMVFEDPNGTRVLYDPGMTVAGPEDPRLGNIDIVLISHMHGDHVGSRHNAAPNTGSCAEPDLSVVAVPNTNVVNIVLAKNAKIVTGSEMPEFFAKKLASLGGDPKNSMLVRFGANKEIGGVNITTVPAVHSNGVHPSMIGGDLGDSLAAAGLGGHVGPPTGYVLKFSNGLVVYLSGDTGITAEQELVVRDYYAAKLVVMNIGDTFTTGPTEAAYVINEMVKPASVIASHANEEATKDGKIIEGTRTDIFKKAVKVPVYAALSDKTLEFNAEGACVSGC